MATSDETTPPSVRQERSLVAELAPGRVAALRAMVAEATTDVAACAALRRLAEHGTRAAVNGVRDAIDDPRSGIRAEAALLLGRLGTAEDLQRVTALRIRSSGLRRKIDFGAALLAHRHGLERPARARLVDVTTTPPTTLDLTPIEVVSEGTDVAGMGATVAPAHTFGAAVAASGPVLQCGTDPTMLLATEAALRDPVEALTGRPHVVAVGVSPAQEVDVWSADWVALSTPTRDGVLALRAYSSSGRLQLAGIGGVERGGVVFELAPVEGAGGPQLVLRGRVGDGALTITSAGRARRATPGRRPTAD